MTVRYYIYIYTHTHTTKLRGLSPRANYTGPVTASEVSANVCGYWCYMVGATDPHGRILDFLDPRSYFFFQVASQLYAQGWVDSVPDPPLESLIYIY
jgi:hypothetical protein